LGCGLVSEGGKTGGGLSDLQIVRELSSWALWIYWQGIWTRVLFSHRKPASESHSAGI